MICSWLRGRARALSASLGAGAVMASGPAAGWCAPSDERKGPRAEPPHVSALHFQGVGLIFQMRKLRYKRSFTQSHTEDILE